MKVWVSVSTPLRLTGVLPLPPSIGRAPGVKVAALIIGKAAAEVIAVAEVVIDLDQAGVVESRGADVDDVVIGADGVGQGPEVQESFGDGVSNLGALSEGGDEGEAGGRGDLAELFVRGEEERFVFLDRAANGAAKLVAVERRLGALGFVDEEIRGVEIGVAEVFEKRCRGWRWCRSW